MPRRSRIPGVSGRRIPSGRGRLPSAGKIGGHLTHVPFSQPYKQSSSVFREYHRQQIRDVRGQFAGGWGFAWVGLADVDRRTLQWANNKTEATKRAIHQLADEITAYMKANAPWNDRTPEARAAAGDDPAGARESLQAKVVWNDNNTFTIWIGHGDKIYYGIWLEVRWGGRYAIIVPTAQYFAPKIGARIKAMN